MKNKKLFLSFIIILIIFNNCVTNKKTVENKKNYKTGTGTGIEFEQDNKIIKPDENNIILLDNKPFYIIIHYLDYNKYGIYLNINNDNKMYNKSINNYKFSKIDVNGKSMAEYNLNKTTELFLSNDSWHYWPYYSDEKHRFKEIIKNGNELIGRRFVDSFLYLEYEGKPKKMINEIKSGTIFYLVFLDFIYENNDQKINNITPLKIKFK